MLTILRHKRKIKGLNQSQLGRRIRKSKSYVSRLERKVKKYEPNLHMIKKLSKELECCPIELFLFFSDIDCKYFKNNKN
ncbi:helix-turn-helix transcriptional regulator [Clostridium botulinum]|uniref:helix-turn-helix domain-containing protein n=1 Tax=Clostridium sp. VAP41 TaxID=2949979 RepID=UPI0009AD3E58|nr:helix-turn-helix transcriptional regulator [Clostridium botulinum]NFI56983.1 helix-turn-helix transcriptional regulator [Clostridium botulinum]NFI81003.1 helix-turn-helix transcriptional regulator [Clostridium botulinum]NFI95620.1 helix-turn-helix transcriptional regulator [Clostridium botulinum]NFK66102.1 helix-turn-helix transcriptional regulator [Clostridium botulinum]